MFKTQKLIVFLYIVKKIEKNVNNNSIYDSIKKIKIFWHYLTKYVQDTHTKNYKIFKEKLKNT